VSGTTHITQFRRDEEQFQVKLPPPKFGCLSMCGNPRSETAGKVLEAISGNTGSGVEEPRV
jgi:hypothetical protein